ncbi:MAG: hypothetical protein ACK4QL_05285 [Pseudanabaenaceae cyanobacterium]
MRQGKQCNNCDFYAHSPFLVCALHPAGPETVPCPDFESAELWQPECPEDFLDQQLGDFFWHPLFTGRCPECGTPFSRLKLPPLHWVCRSCGWEDDTF